VTHVQEGLHRTLHGRLTQQLMEPDLQLWLQHGSK
jgi:hypothetical protein